MAKRKVRRHELRAYLVTVTGGTGLRSQFIVLARNQVEATLVLKRYMWPHVDFGYLVEAYRRDAAIVAAGLVEAYTRQTERNDAKA